MKCVFLGKKGTWRDVANSANTTIDFESISKNEPSSLWKKRMLLAEHSPIRQLWIKAKWYDIKYWTSVHFVRHWLGIVHWVKSQRPDRFTGPSNRDNELQSALINHEFDVNAQAMINISRKRLCQNAMPDTRTAWMTFLNTIKKEEPELFMVCVPGCIYRGYCYEFTSCGYYLTDNFNQELQEYRKNIRRS